MSVLSRIILISSASSALLFCHAAPALQLAVPGAAPALQGVAAPAPQPGAPAVSAPTKAQQKLDLIAKLKLEMGAVESAKGSLVSLAGDSLFDFNQASMRAEAAPTLEKLADLVRRVGKPVQVSGHTDSQGNAEYNKKLSQLRANAVKAALVQRGIRAGAIQVAGYGKDRPKAADINPDGSANVKGRESNRRVDVLISKR